MTQEQTKKPGRPPKTDSNTLPAASKAMELATTPANTPPSGNGLNIGNALQDLLEIRKMDTQMKALDSVNNYLGKEMGGDSGQNSQQLQQLPRTPGQPTPEPKNQPPLIDALKLLPEDQRQEMLKSLLTDDTMKDYMGSILGGNSNPQILPNRQRPTQRPISELGEQTNALLTLAEVAGVTQQTKNAGEANSINNLLLTMKLVKELQPAPTPAPATDPAMAAALNAIAGVLGTVVQSNKETQALLVSLPDKLKPTGDSGKELLELVMNHNKELATEREARFNAALDSQKAEFASREKYYQEIVSQIRETVKPNIDNRESIDRLALEVRRKMEESGISTKEDRELAIAKINAEVEKEKIKAETELTKMKYTADDNVRKEAKQRWDAIGNALETIGSAVLAPGSNVLKTGTTQANNIIGAGR